MSQFLMSIHDALSGLYPILLPQEGVVSVVGYAPPGYLPFILVRVESEEYIQRVTDFVGGTTWKDFPVKITVGEYPTAN